MTRIIDEDIIRQHPVSDAYRDGWERMFGDKNAEPEPSKDGIECRVGYYANYQAPVAVATLPEACTPWPENQPKRYNGCTDPCDTWDGPCCCGAWHHDGK